MSKPAKPTFIVFMMILTLVMSLVFPLSVLADDGLPPEGPGTSEGEVIETEGEVPPEEAVTEESSEREAATPEDEVVEEGEDGTEGNEEEIAEEQPAEESIPETLEAMEDAGVILADENGNPLPLVTEAVENALLFPDPIGCPPGVQPVTWGGTGAGCTASYSSIQAAIDDVSVAAGWTVYIDPGTFQENVTVNKSVTLQGSGVGVTIVQPGAASTPSLACGAGSCASVANTVFYVTADNVTIRDLTIDGDNSSVASGTVVNGVDINARNGIYGNDADFLIVEDTEVKNVYLRGIQVSASDGVEVRNNDIQNVDGSIYSISVFYYTSGGIVEGNTIDETGDGIAANWSTGTQILNNTISNMGTGIHTDNTQASDLISGNTISDGLSNSYGIFVFAPYAPVSVTGNTITNVDIGLTVSGNGWGDSLNTITFEDNKVTTNVMGAYVTTDVWWYFFSDVSAEFNNNVFTGGDYGFYLESNGAGEYYGSYDCSGAGGDCVLDVSGSGNSITGQNLFAATTASGQLSWFNNAPSYYGVYNVDLRGNWWGDASGPNDVTPVPDGCGIVLDNPSGLGGEVSECILYDLWLTTNPFATGGGGGGEPPADDDDDPVLPPLSLFTFGTLAFAGGPLSGEATPLSCETDETTLSVGGVEVIFAGLCGYEVILEAVTEDQAQSALDGGGKFLHGVSITILKDGVPVQSLPADAQVIISFPGSDGVVMQWNGSWAEVNGAAAGGRLEVQGGPGIYIVVDK